jgi:hypothetical protein
MPEVATKTRAGWTFSHFPEPPQTWGGYYFSIIYRKIAREEVRAGARAAKLFCGE